MTSIVLVHGAWHGGWCWRKVTPLLRQTGYEVYTPTLSGLGERVHLAHPAINLHTHIADIVNLVEFEDLSDIILVGHSYAGMVITGVADKLFERIRHLVYLDAVVPHSGESFLNCVPAWTNFAERIEKAQHWTLPPSGASKPYGIESEEDVIWVKSKLTSHPIATLIDPLHLASSPSFFLLKRTYIYCKGDNSSAGQLPPAVLRLLSEPNWNYIELETGHDAMITAPRQLSQILIDLQ